MTEATSDDATNVASTDVTAAATAEAKPRLRVDQFVVVVLLFAGYAAYYFCRSDLSVAMPLLIDELGRRGMTSSEAVIRLGTLSSLGVLVYALGKFFLTGLGDIWGGKRSFTLGLGGAAVFTLLFTAGGALPFFTLAWIGNRLTQSIGWAGLVKVCSKWFNYTAYGTIVGILSVSFLVGDAAARASMGALIRRGYDWRALFVFAAGIAGCMLLASALFLRESACDAGHDEPAVNPVNVFSEDGPVPARRFTSIVRSLLSSRAFVLVCLVSLGSTIVRETFNTWTPLYLQGFFGYQPADAASMSAIFPLVGAVSVIITGWLGDHLGVTGRSTIMFAGLATSGAALVLLTVVPRTAASVIPVALIGVIAFGLLGPYAYLAGAFALDFGGREAGATSSGLIDGVGYLGGVVAGAGAARVSVALGWRGVFAALAAVSVLSALAAVALLLHIGARSSVKTPVTA